MLELKVEKDVVWDLYYNGENIILPWGVEVGDSYSFFSLENGVGYRYEELSSNVIANKSEYTFSKTIKMHDGMWVLEGCDKIVENSVIRTIKATCLEDTLFLDFVMRFRVPRRLFKTAYIYGKRIEHNYTNVYYQYPTGEASLEGKYRIHFKVIDAKVPSKMVPNLYVRDHEDEWVIHARMVPVECDKKVIKLCNSFFKTKPIPQWITNLVCKNPRIYEYLKYHNERTPYTGRIMRRISPNAFPLIWVKKGEELSWTIKMEVFEKRD